MNHSGDAAEQIVRLSLEGVEVAARITGTAAKELATFLVAALKSKNSNLKLKGKARMTSMLKSGKVLEIYSIKERDLQNFMQGAKQYGIVYSVLRNPKNSPDGLCDIMVKADDAPKISRLAERFKFATVDKATIESEIIREKAERAQGAEPEAPDRNDISELLNDLLGKDEGKTAQEQPSTKPDIVKTIPAKETPRDPARARTEKSLPSEPTLERRSRFAEGTSSKPSVKAELREIKAGRQVKQEADTPARDEQQAKSLPRANTTTTHKQPPRGGKTKSKKTKER